MDANPILVTTTRSSLVECVHRGACCVVSADGVSQVECGDCQTVTFPRSALKFAQVLPLLETDAVDRFGITDDEIALMCGSHNAEERHEAAALSILAKVELTERDLQCGTHPPLHEMSLRRLLHQSRDVSAIHNNCSGKHAGFLALATWLGTPTDNYLQPDHPVQSLVREAVCDVYDVTPHQLLLGVDGCAAPNYAMSIKQMALGFARLCDPTVRWSDARRCSIAHMQRAVLGHPFMVAGTDRFCTELMQSLNGTVIGKLGAAGVYCFGLPGQGVGGAIKMDDGSVGPQYVVAMALLKALGVVRQEVRHGLARFARLEVTNCRGDSVGYQCLADGIADQFSAAANRLS